MRDVKARILRKLGVKPASEESFQVLAASVKAMLEYAGDMEAIAAWGAPVLSNLSKLSSSEVKFIESEAGRVELSTRDCQVKVQKLIPRDERKRLAAYYTIQQGLDFMASVTREFLHSRGGRAVLADPFLGSGLTLTAAVEKVGAERVEAVWGIEPLPLPALVAYASLLSSMEGRRDSVTVVVGDAFEAIPSASSKPQHPKLVKADVILTNPPFTRWMHLEKRYRSFLLSTIGELGYGRYVARRDASLQTLSMFLCDYALRDGGLLASVLPASTFYTIYGEGYKSLLKERYGVLALVGSKLRASFSEGSGFKEVIIVAVKGSSRRLTAFSELGDGVEELARAVVRGSSLHAFDLHKLPQFLDINWLALLGDSKLRDLIVNVFKQGLAKGTLGCWSKLLGKSSIIRGIEMYGPDFFFIPNRYWDIVEEASSSIRIGSRCRELDVSRDFLVKALRKPSLYSHKIEADVSTLMLSVPPVDASSLPEGLREYIKWGLSSGTAKPAVRAYGKYWYSHVYRQVKSKRPFSHVFIPDKVDLLFKRRGVFANYAREKMAASKNFYIIRCEDRSHAKLLTGWLNSTIFISALVLLGRRISDRWTRLLESDYLKLPVVSLKADSKAMLEAIRCVEKMMSKPLPPLWEQLESSGHRCRYELDLAIAKLIGVERPEDAIESLYELLSSILHEAQ